MAALHFTRICTITLGLLWLLITLVDSSAQAKVRQQGAVSFGTIPPVAPVLQNYDVECTTGYYSQTNSIGQEIFIPNQWQLTLLDGAPRVHSARIFFAKSCDGSAHVERITGIDSIVIRAQDLETPPAPGKPFDVAFHQPVSATIGGAYSLSGWLLSLCGGSATPSDCPNDYYIAKMIGIDPTGGTDPAAGSVIWTENRHNFWEEGKRVGWQQMSATATAQASTITLFARVQSPFQWHGNHAFLDAFSIVRSPVATLTVPAIVTGTQVTLQWEGEQSPDIEAIAGGNYQLLYDLQFRQSGVEAWRDFLVGQAEAGSDTFTVNCTDTVYEFRIRVRAEQPDPPAPGAWPNHRYAGVWSDPMSVQFQSGLSNTNEPVEPAGPFRLYLPQVANQKQC